ncbi:MAG: hypothetical protein ACHQU0_00175 [Candidatus Paceibacteria bacterium]
MQTLPPAIRDYLVQGKYTPVAISLANKYKLRIDQSGVLEREIALLLMGVENPDDFMKALTEEAKLDGPTVDGIVQDVNAQIFLPLRKAEEVSGTKPTSNAPQAPTPAPVPAHIAPLPPKIAMPQVSRPTLVAAPARSINLLEDHEEPHIEFAPAPVVPPAPRVVVEPPTNLPGMMPPLAPSTPTIQYPPLPKPIQSSVEVPTVPQTPVISPARSLLERMTPPPTTAPATSSAPTKPRAVDPYREPIDEPPVV